jgi:XRE family aerobic/anaerobic benzoate catabolism transcriptional regulator
LERLIEENRTAVIETGGGLVSEPETFERLLTACHTIWLQADPDEHMQRVIEQGDHRPMAGNREAMADLERILAEREALYSKADSIINTSGRSEEDCLDELTAIARPIIFD